jgi:hypothetical protein
MRNTVLSITLLLAAFISGCMQNDPLRSAIGSYRNYTDFNGKIENGVLHDPCGRFTIKIPPLATPGALIRGQLEKEGGSVQFSDDFGKLVRIDIMTASDPQSEELMRSPDWKRIFSGNRRFMGELYQSVSPKTEVLHQEYLTSGRPIDFYVFNLPEGSTLSDQSGKRLDAWRASITIIEGNSIFTLSTQHIVGLPWKEDAAKEEVLARMQKTLLETLQTVTFTSPAPLAKDAPR